VGLLMDTFEDNIERWGQVVVSFDPQESPPVSIVKMPPRPMLICQVCGARFLDSGSLHTHVQSHGRQHVYLRLNGTIMRDFAFVRNEVEECRLVLLQYESAAVAVSANNWRWQQEIQNGFELAAQIAGKVGEIRISVTPRGGSTRAFTIYASSAPEFARADLDDSVVSLNGMLDRGMDERGITAALEDWRARAGHRNELERAYIEGFYEYVLGFALYRGHNPDQAKPHLEHAFTRLSVFRTGPAQTARRVLGVITNGFGALQDCPRDSVFAPVRAFFLENAVAWSGSDSVGKSSESGIYADDFTCLVLDAVHRYYRNEGMDLLLDAMRRHQLSQRAANDVKLRLLSARSAKRDERLAQAREHYECLRHVQLFGKEAKEFLDGQQAQGSNSQ